MLPEYNASQQRDPRAAPFPRTGLSPADRTLGILAAKFGANVSLQSRNQLRSEQACEVREGGEKAHPSLMCLKGVEEGTRFSHISQVSLCRGPELDVLTNKASSPQAQPDFLVKPVT